MKVSSIKLAVGQSLEYLGLSEYIASEMSQIERSKESTQGTVSISLDKVPCGSILAKICLNQSSREFRFVSEGENPEIALRKVIQRFRLAIMNGLRHDGPVQNGYESYHRTAS